MRARLLAAALVLAAALPAQPVDATTSPTRTDWLGTVNAYRATAGLTPVTAEPAWVAGAAKHARYMLETGTITHAEDPSHPAFTPDGDEAGRRGNVAMMWGGRADARTFLDLWMVGPFHAAGILDPRLQRSAYAQATADGTTTAVLDVIRGRDAGGPAPTRPVVWPGDGAGVPLTSYGGGEWPDPLTACAGYTAPTGLPIVIQFPATPDVTSHRLTSAGAPVEHCVYSAKGYRNPDPTTQEHARASMRSRNLVILIPRRPLTVGARYTVSVVAGGSTATSTFTVTDGGFVAARSSAPAREAAPASPRPSPFVAACPDGALPRGVFADVPTADAHGPGIDCVTWWGVAAGRDATRFSPRGTVARGQMASFLLRLADAAGVTIPHPTAVAFDDITGSTHRDAIARLTAAGVMSGAGHRRFAPDDPVTREQMATFLARVWELIVGAPLPAGPDAFDDDAASRHQDAINRVAAAGLAAGVGERRFDPGGTITRGQMATFLARMLDDLARTGHASVPAR